ncbi:UDP-glucose 4-epimerase [Oopsacas minuta]|uniref:UDP-glucose 4-epimerase n=1 Tax=Oopsacas minuta TaxID=111878 RepID=A0AAV7JYP1_9METZ|nr:UDP-glucose 4-epimerase [Oopsacas minuta]
MSESYILVTGGTGYIGSHVASVLLAAGEKVLIVDNLLNSKENVATRLCELSKQSVPFLRGDLTQKSFVEEIFTQYKISTVMHFAAMKAVGESSRIPLEYYHNNLNSLLNLLQEMRVRDIRTFIFSSSATVYGDPIKLPITEQHPVGNCTNPYGRTKYYSEQILTDLYASEPDKWKICLLRYFNPVGAHPTKLLGEDPTGVPSNLLPATIYALAGKIPEIKIFGDDYPTPDGTGVRDYIHIMDLSEGHLSALKYCNANTGLHVFNLGTGNGYSVLDVINMVEKVSGKQVPKLVTSRRDGDIATCYADASLAKDKMGWEAKRGLEEMCRDAYEYSEYCSNTKTKI